MIDKPIILISTSSRVPNAQALVYADVSTNNSVESMARSAGDLGFNTYVVKSACFAFEKTDFGGREHSAKKEHAMSLANHL
ncbi:isochorismatase family protein [Marinomonas sp.]|nr:isochorismatase family protein [Marinomonas sp.]MDB4837899.1 isochorismatase family protein [Marinomonas sp.]